MSPRLDAQMRFLMEADRLKTVARANILLDNSRPENAAEHSWHLCLWALVMECYAPADAKLGDVLAMLLVHDLVEIDAGDVPIHLPNPDQDALEARAADRIFALLPPDQAATLRALWERFEAADDASARWAKALDHIAPVFQVFLAPNPLPEHVAIGGDNLATGRAARLAHEWPEIHVAATALARGAPITDPDLAARLAFLAEADQLKSVHRATRLTDGSRFENSAEHSWHLALFALVLSEHTSADATAMITQLILHDLVEIDAGDVPIFASGDSTQDADEALAATRIFGLLPALQGTALRTLWEEFEAKTTPEARFAKSLDRFQPPNLNLANGGGSWVDYDVSEDTVRTKVGAKIEAGAPALWAWLSPKITAFFARRETNSARSTPDRPNFPRKKN